MPKSAEIDVFTAVDIASQWWSVMTWSDPGVCMYAFGSTGRVQSEDHRKDCLEYIDKDCMPGLLERDDDEAGEDMEQLRLLRDYIELADIEEV